VRLLFIIDLSKGQTFFDHGSHQTLAGGVYNLLFYGIRGVTCQQSIIARLGNPWKGDVLIMKNQGTNLVVDV
jgi:hypothetical protein